MKPLRAFALCVTTSLVLVAPSAASAQVPASDKSGGAAYQAPTPVPTPPPAPQDITVPGAAAQILPDGTAAAPADAPPQVQQAIWAANKIQDKPYIYGGGHAKVEDKGYDCSGTVSYALLAAKLIKGPLDSSSFMRWGLRGKGTWITVYTNPGHAFAVIAGLRLDTSTAGVISRKIARTAERGPRWRAAMRTTRGFKKRHPVGF